LETVTCKSKKKDKNTKNALTRKWDFFQAEILTIWNYSNIWCKWFDGMLMDLSEIFVQIILDTTFMSIET